MATAQKYFNVITVIEAQTNLVNMGIGDYPKMTKDGRQKFHRSMSKMAYPPGLQKEMSFEDFARKMKNGK